MFISLTFSIEEVINKANIRICDIQEVVLIGDSTILKIKEMITKRFQNIKINDSINPDETVAYGARVDIFKIYSKKSNFKEVLLNIIPLGEGKYY